MIPLSKVGVKSELRGPIASTTVELTYVSLNQESPLECKFVLPLEKTTLLAKFEAAIDDRSFLTKVMKKDKAEEKYDDAVADGKAAVMA